MKEILAQKLTSRKLWLSIIGVVIGALMVFFDMPTEGSGLIAASLLGGVGSEAIVDAARLLANRIITTNTTTVSASTTAKDVVENQLNKEA